MNFTADQSAVALRISKIGKQSVKGFLFSFLPVALVPIVLLASPLVILPFQPPRTEGAELDYLSFSSSVASTTVLFFFVWIPIAVGFARVTRTWFVTPAVGVLWLRRFNYEAGNRFRVSEAFDELSKFGVSVTTLEDARVQISGAQRSRIRANLFATSMVPVLLVFFLTLPLMVLVSLPQCENYSCKIDEFGAGFGPTIWMLAFAAAALGCLVASYILGNSIALGRRFVNTKRNDFWLAGATKLQKHNRILRVNDSQWKRTVEIALTKLPIVVIDVTNISEHVAWELERVSSAKTINQVLMIRGRKIIFAKDLEPHRVSEIRKYISEVANRGNMLVYPHGRDGDWPDLFFRDAVALRIHEMAAAQCNAQNNLPKAAAG